MTPFVIHQSLPLDFVEKNFYLIVMFDTYIFTKCKLTKKKIVQNVFEYRLNIRTNCFATASAKEWRH